jgi:hypothetical protein
MEKVKMFIRRWLSCFGIAGTNSTVLEWDGWLRRNDAELKLIRRVCLAQAHAISSFHANTIENGKSTITIEKRVVFLCASMYNIDYESQASCKPQRQFGRTPTK